MLLYSALLGTAPSSLIMGTVDTPEVAGVDPKLIAGFSEAIGYNATDFSFFDSFGYYDYDLGSYDWRVISTTGSGFRLGVKVYLWIFWFGALDFCEFKSPFGMSRGDTLSFAELDEDMLNGTVTYSAVHSGGGGGLIFYYNTTTYTDSSDAWDNDALQMIHGIGIGDSAPINIVSIILGLLTFRFSDIPVIINVLLNVPFYAGTIWLVWLVVKEFIPL